MKNANLGYTMRALAIATSGMAIFTSVPTKASVPGVPQYSDIMPIDQVKAGMKGYGLTVFHGTKIERFAVTVVGVVKRGSLIVPGHDMILVRMAGGPMTLRSAFLIRGMSGSPVYINGKIVGAFSQGEPASKEPLGGVTPIEDMMEAWDSRLPQSPLTGAPDRKIRDYTLAQPIFVGNRRIDRVVYNVPANQKLKSGDHTLVMHPCTSFATINTVSRAARQKISAMLEPYNVELLQGAMGAGDTKFAGSALVPGAAFSMMLANGDFTMGATGTVTYRKENRILGFGHPFMNIGPIEAALCSAWIHDVYPLTSGSYKISSPGPIVGSSVQDRNFSVSGTIGKLPKLIPVTVDVKDLTTGRSRKFTSNSVTHPSLYAALVSTAVSAAVGEIRSNPGATMANVVTTVEADEVGKLTRSNIVFDARGIDGAVTADLDEMLQILGANPFYPVALKNVHVSVELETGRRTATLERVFLKSSKFEPGETVDLGVVLKPYKLPSFTKVVKLNLPANIPNGRYTVVVKGGFAGPGMSFGGLTIRPSGGTGTEQSPPVNIKQMASRLLEREKNSDLQIRMLLPSTSVSVDGERLTGLPPNLEAIFRSSKSSVVRLERDDVKLVEPTEWVVSGQQVINLSVQRRETLEPNSAGPVSGAFQPGGIGSGGGAGNATFDSDSAEFSVLDRKLKPNRAVTQDEVIDESDQEADDTPITQSKLKGGKSKSVSKIEPEKPSADGAKAMPTPVDKPVGRMPQTWKQTAKEFARGEFHELSVNSANELTKSPKLSKFAAIGEVAVCSLVSDEKGGWFAGSGSHGSILHIDSSGAQKLLAKLPDSMVISLCLQSDGNLIAGTGPHGRTYLVRPDGKYTLIHQASEKYVLAVAVDKEGNTLSATGGSTGRVYKIDKSGTVTTILQSADEHVVSLVCHQSGNIYAGTSGHGLLYKLTPQMKSTVVYDAAEATISGLAIGKSGDVYLTTAPRGGIYRLGSGGSVKTILERTPANLSTIQAGSNGTLLAVGGNYACTIDAKDVVVPLNVQPDAEYVSAAINSEGKMAIGSANVGEVWMASSASNSTDLKWSGTFVSNVHDAKAKSTWGTLRSSMVSSDNSSIQLQTRSGASSEPDFTWSDWQSLVPSGGSSRVASPDARYIQYRVQMEGVGESSPALKEVNIIFLSQNMAPKITLQSPISGEKWSGSKTIRWEGTDPDKDTLAYEIYISLDGTSKWLPLPESAVRPTVTSTEVDKTPKPDSGIDAKVPLGSGPPTLEVVQAELDKHPEMPAAMRAAILDRAKAVNSSVKRPISGVGEQSLAGSSTRENSRTIDTTLLKEGTYKLKIVASDKPSNPVGFLQTELISESFVVSNSTPMVIVDKMTLSPTAAGDVTVKGFALHAAAGITTVQYRLDGGDWIAAIADDRIFDSGLEGFHFTSVSLKPGKHALEIKSFSGSGTQSLDKFEIAVPN